MTENAKTINKLAWQMVTSPDAAARQPEIALKLANIAIELAGGDKDLESRLFDMKARALFLLGKREQAIAEQEKAIAAATMAEEKAGLETTLAAYKNDELPEIALPADRRIMIPNPETASVSVGAAYIVGKLRNIVLPLIDLEDVTLEEAVEFSM